MIIFLGQNKLNVHSMLGSWKKMYVRKKKKYVLLTCFNFQWQTFVRKRLVRVYFCSALFEKVISCKIYKKKPQHAFHYEHNMPQKCKRISHKNHCNTTDSVDSITHVTLCKLLIKIIHRYRYNGASSRCTKISKACKFYVYHTNIRVYIVQMTRR